MKLTQRELIMTDKIIMIDSDESAKRGTVEGWISRHGRFYGDCESAARYEGCTHVYCESCNAAIPKHGMTICKDCEEKKDIEKYNAMPRKKWDGETPLYSESNDEYFQDEDDLNYFIEEHECSIESLRLIICEPNRFRMLDCSFFEDDTVDDGELPEELEVAIAALNSVIETLPPVSWSPGKYAADL
mgnify:FL=1